MSKQYEKDELGGRMKTYEYVNRQFLTLGVPHVIRVDMRAGHTFCKHFKRPFDDIFSEAMVRTAKALCEQIPGVKMAYTQSDEISLALNDDFGNVGYQCFFDGNVNKIVSISAAIASVEFNKAFQEIVNEYWGEEFVDDNRVWALNKKVHYYTDNFNKAIFDSRVFSVPNEIELHNYFLWRQQDATRNSILSMGYANFTQAEMDGKNCEQIQDMLHDVGLNWNNLPVKYKRGILLVRAYYRKEVDFVNPSGISVKTEAIRHKWTEEIEIPILTQQPMFVPTVFNDQTGALFQVKE